MSVQDTGCNKLRCSTASVVPMMVRQNKVNVLAVAITRKVNIYLVQDMVEQNLVIFCCFSLWFRAGQPQTSGMRIAWPTRVTTVYAC